MKQQERLFAMLEQKNGEIKFLLGEIKNLEKFKTLYESMESKPSTSASLVLWKTSPTLQIYFN